MKDLKQKLIIEQIDNKLKVYSKVNPNNMPSTGWINTIRTSIKMTLEQLGFRINTTKQGAKKVIERVYFDTFDWRLYTNEYSCCFFPQKR